MQITLIGLGVNSGDISLRALDIIKKADKVIVRTDECESVKFLFDLNIDYISLDYIYKKSRTFDTLNNNLAKEVLNASKTNNVVYLVDGAVYEDNSCKIIISKHKDVSVINGISKSDNLLSQTHCFGNFTSYSAYDIQKINKAVYPLIVYDVDSQYIASEVKLKLIEIYGDELKVKLFIDNKILDINLYELDFYDKYNYQTCLFIPETKFLNKNKYDIDDLFDIIRFLRAPNGCPWDREQTKESLKNNLIEECYELIDAINKNDDESIKEEIGDVFLQLVFHTIFGEERSAFTYYDVMTAICDKLIFRHSHIYGNDTVNNSDDVKKLWDKNKMKEKRYASAYEYLNSVPISLPANMRAEKVSKRASKYNFEFENIEQLFSKIEEEICEVRQELLSGNKEKLKQECGDLMFACSHAVGFMGIDAEEVLNYSVNKFIDRFGKMEKLALKEGRNIAEMTLKDWDKYYNEVKKS